MKEGLIEMERSKVICHMMTSLNGKTTGKFLEESTSNLLINDYYELAFKLGNGMAVGRATSVELLGHLMDEALDLSMYKDRDVTHKKDFINNQSEEANYFFNFDRKGRCNWIAPTVEYDNKHYRIVQVLTEDVKKEYLAHLQAIGIPYLLTGKEDMDIPLALKKIKSYFKIETLVLCGGAVLNGAFFKANVIDSLSLVISPYIESCQEEKTAIDYFENFKNITYSLKETNPLEKGGLHLLFETENGEKTNEK